ncbi:MAG: DUF1674 domain-containing protein [Rubellimicrobium sp.]|nr:DUF1674 domain-containing protein [Rubellimicrobium sp.]
MSDRPSPPTEHPGVSPLSGDAGSETAAASQPSGRPPGAAGNVEGYPDDLPPAARRALAEAEARRRAAPPQPLPTELGGRDGPEPVRYGDWERRGIAVDF